MNNQKWQIIVIGSDDEKCGDLRLALKKQFDGAEVGFTHKPINGNRTISANGFYDSLMKGNTDNVAIVDENVVQSHQVIIDLVSRFESSSQNGTKPLLGRRYRAEKSVWCKNYDWGYEIFVGKRDDVSAAVERFFGKC